MFAVGEKLEGEFKSPELGDELAHEPDLDRRLEVANILNQFETYLSERVTKAQNRPFFDIKLGDDSVLALPPEGRNFNASNRFASPEDVYSPAYIALFNRLLEKGLSPRFQYSTNECEVIEFKIRCEINDLNSPRPTEAFNPVLTFGKNGWGVDLNLSFSFQKR